MLSLVYCLILLFFILNKAIESLFAKKIAYSNNKYGFLPKNYFDRLRCKNIIDILIVL